MACQVSDPEQGRTVALGQTVGVQGPLPMQPSPGPGGANESQNDPPHHHQVGGVDGEIRDHARNKFRLPQRSLATVPLSLGGAPRPEQKTRVNLHTLKTG